MPTIDHHLHVRSRVYTSLPTTADRIAYWQRILEMGEDEPVQVMVDYALYRLDILNRVAKRLAKVRQNG